MGLQEIRKKTQETWTDENLKYMCFLIPKISLLGIYPKE